MYTGTKFRHYKESRFIHPFLYVPIALYVTMTKGAFFHERAPSDCAALYGYDKRIAWVAPIKYCTPVGAQEYITTDCNSTVVYVFFSSRSFLLNWSLLWKGKKGP